MPSPIGKIAFVEMHDMRVDRASIEVLGVVELSLGHVAVYHELAKELYDVWSYQAVLRCRGVSRFGLTGFIAKEERVLDGVILDDANADTEMTALLKELPINSLEIVFESGAKMVMHASHMRLELLDALKKIEQWRGPLEAGPGGMDK